MTGRGDANAGTTRSGVTPTRRRLLATMGATAVAAGIGGCAGDGETVTENVADDPDVFALPFQYFPEDAQLNPWAGRYPWNIHTLLFEPLSVVSPQRDRQLSELIADVDVDETTVTVTYSDEFSWWNGEPVTARDRWIGERIQSFVRGVDVDTGDERDDREISPDELRFETGEPLGTEAKAVALRDDFTISYEFERPVDRPLALSRVLGESHTIAAWYFEPWLERLTDATTSAEREAIVSDLRRTTIRMEEMKEVGYGCGPYEPVEVSANRLIFEPFADHPRVENLTIPRLWLPVAMEHKTEELIANGSIDGGHGVLEDRDRRPPEHVEQLATYRSNGGTKLALNWRSPHLARTNVRRALVSVLPLDEIASVGRWGEPARTQTGLTIPLQRRWLEESFRASLHRYPVSGDVERATAYMRDAGYTRTGDGQWRGPDGTEVAFRLRSPTWRGWSAATQLIALTLEEFGFVIDFNEFPDHTFLALIDQGDFDLVPWWTDGDPYTVYDVTRRNLSTLGYDLDDGGVGGSERTSQYDKPIEPSVPVTPGDVHGENGRETVSLREQWRRISRPTAEAETADAVATVTRWWNAELPDIDLATSVTGVWGNTRDFSWPPAGDSSYRRSGPEYRPEIQLLLTGAIGLAREE